MPRKWTDGDVFFGQDQSILFGLGADDEFVGFVRDAEFALLADAEGNDIKDAQ